MKKSEEKIDTRQIIRGISFAGEKNADGVSGKMKIVTDVDELQALADAGTVNLKQLLEAGAIRGDWALGR
jgi:hypothetical protein